MAAVYTLTRSERARARRGRGASHSLVCGGIARRLTKTLGRCVCPHLAHPRACSLSLHIRAKNELEYFRIRCQKHEVMVAPGKTPCMCILRDQISLCGCNVTAVVQTPACPPRFEGAPYHKPVCAKMKGMYGCTWLVYVAALGRSMLHCVHTLTPIAPTAPGISKYITTTRGTPPHASSQR